jgi:hypothetical protein
MHYKDCGFVQFTLPTVTVASNLHLAPDCNKQAIFFTILCGQFKVFSCFQHCNTQFKKSTPCNCGFQKLFLINAENRKQFFSARFIPQFRRCRFLFDPASVQAGYSYSIPCSLSHFFNLSCSAWYFASTSLTIC